jgi:hypothetical protein
MAPTKTKKPAKARDAKVVVKQAPVQECDGIFYSLNKDEKDNLNRSLLKKQYPVISRIITGSINDPKVIRHEARTTPVEVEVYFKTNNCIEVSFSCAGYEFISITTTLHDKTQYRNAGITVESKERYVSHLHPIHPSGIQLWFAHVRMAVYRIKQQIEYAMKPVNAAITAKAEKAAKAVTARLANVVDSENEDDDMYEDDEE